MLSNVLQSFMSQLDANIVKIASDPKPVVKYSKLKNTEVTLYNTFIIKLQGCRGDGISIPIPIPYPQESPLESPWESPWESPYPRNPN